MEKKIINFALVVLVFVSCLPALVQAETLLTNIMEDFSTDGTNPVNNWSHGQYMGAETIAYTPDDFELMPNFIEWQGTYKFSQEVSTADYKALILKRPIPDVPGWWCYSVPDSLLPGGATPVGGQGTWTVSRWTSDYAGSIEVDMTCFRAPGTIEAGISVDGVTVWSTSSISPDKYNPDILTIEAYVNIGSAVDFYVNPLGSRGQDGFFYQAQINAVAGPVLLEGDANHDGVVSAGDYASVQANFGNTGEAGIPGDANLDAVVSAGDYASVQANFGNTSGAAETAPEPASMCILSLGVIALIKRRK